MIYAMFRCLRAIITCQCVTCNCQSVKTCLRNYPGYKSNLHVLAPSHNTT